MRDVCYKLPLICCFASNHYHLTAIAIVPVQDAGDINIDNVSILKFGLIRDSMADITLARRHLGYEPLVDFGEGLSRTVKWFEQNRPESSA